MNNKKKIIQIATIIILLVILLIISILILSKNKELTKTKELDNVLYNGKVNCTMEIPGERFYKTFILDELEVKEGIVQNRSFLYKIIYMDKDNYEGFKANEEVTNPKYDDENLTIIYERDKKLDLSKNNLKYQEYIKELEDNGGYTCTIES